MIKEVFTFPTKHLGSANYQNINVLFRWQGRFRDKNIIRHKVKIKCCISKLKPASHKSIQIKLWIDIRRRKAEKMFVLLKQTTVKRRTIWEYPFKRHAADLPTEHFNMNRTWRQKDHLNTRPTPNTGSAHLIIHTSTHLLNALFICIINSPCIIYRALHIMFHPTIHPSYSVYTQHMDVWVCILMWQSLSERKRRWKVQQHIDKIVTQHKAQYTVEKNLCGMLILILRK